MELENTDIIFTRKPMSSGKGNKVNTRPTNKNNGDPGGCGTAILYAVAINSPQSQNETVGATVRVYTIVVKTNTMAAVILFTLIQLMKNFPLKCEFVELNKAFKTKEYIQVYQH